jgi:VWFA-related protein
MMTSGQRVSCVMAAVAVLCAPLAWAQQQDRPSFRASARVVEVSIVVTDRDGNPVTGLTAADFQAFDDDKPQKVEFFSIEGPDAAAAALTVAPPPRPGEFSNKVADASGVTIILFDQLNTPADARMRARDHVIGFLEQIRPTDHVGLYVLTADGALRIIHDFSNDAASLVRAVSRLRGGISPMLAGEQDGAQLEAEIADMAERFGDVAGTSSVSGESGGKAMMKHFGQLRGMSSIDVLEAIGHHLSGVQQRKNLIWVSGGFPLGALRLSKTKEINRATRALNDANVALYPVDARGLMPAFSGVPGKLTFTTLSMVAGNQDILQLTAEGTGGRAFLNTNDIQGAVRRAADDARRTYVLGYYPTNDVWDGRFHRIRVKVDRPGLEVRHRKGYFAVATQAQASAQRSAALQAAVASPIDASGLGLTLRIDPVEGTPADYRLTIHVNAGALALEPRAGESHGALDVIVAQIRADGADAGRSDHTVDIRLSGDRLQQFLRNGLKFDRTVTLNPDAGRLRIVVRDVRTGALGAIGINRQQLQAIPR